MSDPYGPNHVPPYGSVPGTPPPAHPQAPHPQAPHPQAPLPQAPRSPASYAQRAYPQGPYPQGAWPATSPPPPPSPAPVRSGRPWLWFALYVPIVPILVMISGALLYLCAWLGAVIVVALTAGAISADPEAESWVNQLLSEDGFSDWMSTTLTLGLRSLLTMVVVGSVALVLLTRGSRTGQWPPFGQASAAAGIALLPAAAAALLPLLG